MKIQAGVLGLAFLTAGMAVAANDVPKRLAESVTVLSEIMGAPDKGIPQDLLDKASCIVVVPGVKKAAFIVGAKYGKGFVSCRPEGGKGWSAPASVRVEGGNFGFQIGVSETDVVMLVMNQSGMNKLMSDKFTLGADASVAGGPVGRTSSADTDAMMRAEILSWSRSRGVFAGIALNGATLRPDEDSNTSLYGKSVSNREIVSGTVKTPGAAVRFVRTLTKYSSRKSA